MSAMRTILVIDDSPLIRHVVQLALASEPAWQVHMAESGAEGVDLALRVRADVILLDVEMPDLDGPATLARLRAHEAVGDVPVVFLTGHATDEDRRRLGDLGAAGVIAKPFDPSGLAGEVIRLLRWTP